MEVMAKLWNGVDRLVETMIIVLVVGMVLAGGAQVFNRFVLNRSLSWSEEFQRYAHIWVVYLAIPVAYRRGMHIGMDILKERFPKRVQVVLSYVNHLLWITLGSSIILFSQRILQVTARQRSPGMGLQMNYVYLGLVIGASYLVIVAIRKLVTQLLEGSS